MNRLPFSVAVALGTALACLAAACSQVPGWMVVQGKSAITDYRHFDAADIARAPVASPLPAAAKASLRLPPLPADVAFDTALANAGTVAFIVVQRGEVVYERYFNGYARDSVVASFSVAKSFVSALVGIALAEGKIGSLDEPITRYLPELATADARFERITIRHLLAMRSGIRFEEAYGSPFADASIFYLTSDLQSRVAALRIERAPDQVLHYNSGNTQLLGIIVQRATGVPLAQYLQDKIWQPMGAAYDASWSVDSKARGIAKAFCCINARALDYARFGLVFLNGGSWNGRQIVPAEWVAQSTGVRELAGSDAAARWNIHLSGTERSAYYAWQWRRTTKAAANADLGIQPAPDYYAQGLHGQFIYVAPEQDMVIVRLGRQTGEIFWPALMARIAALNPRSAAAAAQLLIQDASAATPENTEPRRSPVPMAGWPRVLRW